MSTNLTRRHFLGTATALLGGVFINPTLAQKKPRAKVERLGVAGIGLRYQGSVITLKAQAHGDIVALADVDRNVREQARASFGSTPKIFENYQDLIKRKDVDVVMIGTPDHWHSKMVIDACRAGKDVYVEKPLTLTVDEGKLLTKVAAETDRVVQVGSWQRSDHRFRLAVELVRQGKIGKVKEVKVVLAKHPTGGPFKATPPPKSINWNLWQGQTPAVPYVEERCHYTFRWWYEYSGGKMTDWGAHHLDIAQWAIGSDPVQVDGKAVFPKVENGYNVPIDYSAVYTYGNDVRMTVLDTGKNGITFIGDRGRIFVDRGKILVTPKSLQLPREKFTLYANDNLERPARMGKYDSLINHVGNFFDCIESRKVPISDAMSQHKSAITCHIGTISMRLGRPLKWNPEKEEFVDDKEANQWLSREQRKGFEIS